MVSKAHFKRLSSGLKHLWEEGYLTDTEITTTDNPVKLHKVVLLIFSAFNKESSKSVSSFCSSASKETSESVSSLHCNSGYQEVQTFVKFLYDSDANIEKYFPELIQDLGLDLIVNETVKKKKDCKELSKQENVNLELKYLRDLTFEQAAIRIFQKGCLHSDITLRTGKKLHKCHKVMLAALSDYFKVMFVSGMKESEDDTISLTGVDSHIFSLVLQYIYTGSISINVANVQDLLSTSVYLQISPLQRRCEQFLINQLDEINCIDVWNLGKLYDCDDMCTGAWRYILDNFANIPASKLVGIPMNEMITLIKDDNLNASEREVIMSVLRWLEKSELNEEKYIEILRHIRFSLIPKDFIDQVLLNNSVFRKSKTCTELMKKALQGNTDKEILRKEKMFLVLRGSASATMLEVSCYSLLREKWFKLQSANVPCGTSFAVCVSSSGNDLYLTGGSSHQRCCHHYSIHDNKWTAKADMNEGRSSHGAGFVDGKVYVLGGFSAYLDSDLNGSIEKYDVQTDTWTVVSMQQIPTYDSACAVVKSKIYLFGGTMPVVPGSYVNHIQCFDTQTENCTVVYQILPMPLSLGVAVACSYNSDIYIVCPRGDILHFSEDDPPTVVHPAGDTGCMGFGVAFYDHKLYIMGGYNQSASNCIRYYDLKRKMHVTLLEKLPFDKRSQQIFATVANISKQNLTYG